MKRVLAFLAGACLAAFFAWVMFGIGVADLLLSALGGFR